MAGMFSARQIARWMKPRQTRARALTSATVDGGAAVLEVQMFMGVVADRLDTVVTAARGGRRPGPTGDQARSPNR
jgi:hypothetical protein